MDTICETNLLTTLIKLSNFYQFGQMNDCECNQDLEKRIQRKFVRKRVGLIVIIGIVVVLTLAYTSANAAIAYTVCQ